MVLVDEISMIECLDFEFFYNLEEKIHGLFTVL